MFNIFNIIILIGTIHGFIISILLLFGSKSKKSKLYLSLVLLGFSAILLRITLIDIGNQQLLPPLIINFILLIAPALYLYVVTLSNKDVSLKLVKTSFLPLIIINLGFILFYSISNKDTNYQTTIGIVLKLNEILSLIYYGIYLFVTFRYFNFNKVRYTLVQSRWLNRFIFLQFLFFIIWSVYVLAELAIFNFSLSVSDYYPMMMIISVILYYISFYVYNNRASLFQPITLSKRKNYILSEGEGENLLMKLNSIMNEDKPYLDGELSLNTLASTLNTHPKTLSFVINEYCNKNFNDYINEWRIEEVKKRLKDDSHNHLKMLSIAFDCGFNSKSTFNLAFKKATGLSPSEFRKEN